MKISAEALDTIKTHVGPLDTWGRREQYLRGDIPNAGAVKDLNKRYRWDLLWAAGVPWSVFDGLDDSHIDTALRSFIPPLV